MDNKKYIHDINELIRSSEKMITNAENTISAFTRGIVMLKGAKLAVETGDIQTSMDQLDRAMRVIKDL